MKVCWRLALCTSSCSSHLYLIYLYNGYYSADDSPQTTNNARKTITKMASQTNLLPLVLLLCYVGLGSVYAFHLIKYSAGHIRSRGSYGAIDEQQQRGLWNHQTEATKRWSSTSTVDSEQEQIQISPENADRLQSYFSFPLDRWQLEAGEVLCNNASCIVCAPTGVFVYWYSLLLDDTSI